MKWNYKQSFINLLAFGVLIACSSIIYLFFNFYNIMDLLVFFTAGYLLSRKVFGNHWQWGLVLAIPCMLLNAFIVYQQGYANISSGIGTGFLAALFVIPAAACLGMFVGARRRRIPTS
jgi:hypothetical protein